MSLHTPREPVLASRPRDSQQRAVSLERGAFATARAKLDVAAASCRGPRHAVNEDCHSELDRGVPVYVVADGVGGGAMASRASRELVALVHRALDGRTVDAQAVRDALLDADRGIARSIATETTELGAATVALCASAEPSLATWLVAWVGDCRAYRIAANARCELLTRDDTYEHLAEVPPPGASIDDPARMIGNGAVDAPNLAHVELDDGGMLALCSDGVHKHVSGVEIAQLLHDAPAPLARRCARVIALARTRGSADDATLLVVRRIAGVPRTFAWSRGALALGAAFVLSAAIAASLPSFVSFPVRHTSAQQA